MWKYKTQSLIGIFGLAFGLACFVPALYWMHYETTYDSFYPDSENIYRVYSVEKQSGKVNRPVPGILSKKLIEQYPAIEASAGFSAFQFNYSSETTPHIRLYTLYVDSAFFHVFPQESVSGDISQALQLAGNMVLTETVALRLFGDVDKAIGQKYQHALSRIFGPCTVTAVVNDPPSNTNFPFEAILNLPAIQDASLIMPEAEQWKYFNNDVYVKFHPSANIKELESELSDYTSRINVNSDIELRILPVSKIRHQLSTDLPFALNFIGLFVAAGILLLFSSLFNFLNLHLNLFRQRIYEFRQRMVHGAKSSQLIWQMMFELACAVLLALLLGCCFVLLARPVFSELLSITMPVSLLLGFYAFCGLGMMVLVLFVGFISCWRLNQVIVKDLSKKKLSGQPVLQRMAVSFQLAVSIVFIVAASVIMMQMHFVNNKDLGFDHSGIIQLYSTDVAFVEHQEALRSKLETIPQILTISATVLEAKQSADPRTMTTKVEWQGKQPNEEPVFQLMVVDHEFAETYNLKMLTGKWWGKGEDQKVVLNEEAVRIMGLTEPVGTIIRMDPLLISNDGMVPMKEYEVIGVVNNFHSESLRNPIHPAIFRAGGEHIWYMRVIPGLEQEVIQQITAILPDIDKSLVDISLTTLDELYERMNYSEQTGLKLFSVLATVCLLISLFGIYAVATSATQRRRKEIAIRKIVGAKAEDMVRMFFREYTLLVLIAAAFALPLAYFAMNNWLQGYAYRTNIPWWLLAGVIVGVILVVLLTVLGQVLKAANSNPAEVVKNE